MRYVLVDDMLNAQPYLDALPQLVDALPPGAARFATDPGHYDFFGSRCVHDLELGGIQLPDEERAPAELHFVGNKWKHDEDLVLRYEGLTSLVMTISTGLVMGSRMLGDMMLDEILPVDAGVTHEMAFEGGRVELVANDLVHSWTPMAATD